MIVTDKEYFMERKLIDKLDLMIKRMQGTDDNVICIDGDEGQGKTNLAMAMCYYVSHKMGREYNVKENIFFDLDEVIKFASTTSQKIIHWDEGALGGMSVQWWKQNQQKFIQLLMTARKKKHFIIICIPHFYKLNEYIVIDRSIALVHVYSRKNIQKGRFCYYTKTAKERLMDDWRRKHVKHYKKYKTFWGSFPEAEKKIFSKEEQDQYEAKKDEAIATLAKSKQEDRKEVLIKRHNMHIINQLEKMGFSLTNQQYAKIFSTSDRTIGRYKEAIKHEKDVRTTDAI